MFSLLEQFFLSQWLVVLLLLALFFFLTRWTYQKPKQVIPYSLGWVIGLFFVLSYAALAGTAPTIPTEPTTASVTALQVIGAAIGGLIFGALVQMAAQRSGQGGKALQVGIFTAVGVILLFLTIVGDAWVQRMTGLFTLAAGMVTLFVAALANNESETQPAADSQTGSKLSAAAQADSLPQVHDLQPPPSNPQPKARIVPPTNPPSAQQVPPPADDDSARRIEEIRERLQNRNQR